MSNQQTTPSTTVRHHRARRALVGTLSALIAITVAVLIVAASGSGQPRRVVNGAPAMNFMGLHYFGNGASPTVRIAQPAPARHCAYIRPEHRCVENR
jgi:hypothetical protein